MECFNCNRLATKKLSLEADFGFLNVCDSKICKERVELDLKRFQETYENSRSRQGRSKEQVEASERAVAFSIAGMVVITLILILISFLNKQ
jgi:hypothetical protein